MGSCEVIDEFYVCVCLVVQSCPTLRLHGLQPASLLCPGDSPGKSTGVGCHALLQGIFPTQGSNLGLPHCTCVLHHLSHQGSPGVPFTKTNGVILNSKTQKT